MSISRSRRASARFRLPIRPARLGVGLVAAALAVTVPLVGAVPAVASGTPSFPRAAWSKAIGPTHLSSPVIADVNGDGHLDVVTADLSGMLHVLDGRTGRDLPGWPQPVQVIPGSTVAVESSPTVADLDHNGQMEIIVGAGSIDVPDQQGGVVAFNANGSVRFRIQTMTLAGQNGVVGTPAVGDVNGDGFPDVVFGSFDHRIYALDRFGRALPGFPIDSLDTIWDSPALYDEAHIGRDGHLPRRRREPGWAVRIADLVGDPACDPRDARSGRRSCGRAAGTRSTNRARRSATSTGTAAWRSSSVPVTDRRATRPRPTRSARSISTTARRCRVGPSCSTVRSSGRP